MDYFVIAVVISLLIYFFIGSYVGRRVKNIDDYFVAGRKAPTLLIVGTLVASYASTGMFLGETGFAYDGYPFVLWGVVVIMINGCTLGAIYFGRFLRKSEALTVPDFFGQRFHSKHVRRMAGITTVFGVTLYMVGVMQGMSLIFSELLGVPYWLSLCAIWFIFTSFTFYSGSRGVLITDTLMFLVFTVAGLAGSLYILNALGGWEVVLTKLNALAHKQDIIAWHGVNQPGAFFETALQAFIWMVTLGVVWASVVAVSPWQSGRYLMAKNQHVVIRSGMIATVIMAFFSILMMPTGAAINLLNPSINPSEQVMIWTSVNVFPMVLGVLTITGIFAAGLSSCSTFLSLVGFSLSHDIIGITAQNKRSLNYSRLSMLVSGLVALVLALLQPTAVMAMVYFAATLFASSWGPIAFVSVWSKNVTAPAAYWSICIGFFGNLAVAIAAKMGLIQLPVFLDPFIIGVVLSTLALIVISPLSQPSKQALAFQAALHEPQPQTDTPAAAQQEQKTTAKIAIAIMAIGVFVSCYLVFNYARHLPQLYPDNTSAQIGGWLIALLFGVPMVVAGFLGYKTAKRL
ncbi:MAG: sodium:solute symporter family protein [Neisseriaceae bacterium]|nr:sodium:solute symporter family protein [Neisseriaceae bacterium]MBP6862746.1 sodium:solute symporter family protein [Neisseriaceae bacterium]